MSTLIVRTAARILLPLLLLYGLFLLLRGHNAPGGGFAGGLVVAAAYSLSAFAFGVPAARRALLVDPSRLIGAGLLGSALTDHLTIGFILGTLFCGILVFVDRATAVLPEAAGGSADRPFEHATAAVMVSTAKHRDMRRPRRPGKGRRYLYATLPDGTTRRRQLL